MSERLPSPVAAHFPELEANDVRVLAEGTLVGRIYSTGGPYGSLWNTFRAWGPTSSRFDHHPLPARLHPSRGVLYAAPAISTSGGSVYPVLKTCLAECYRDRGLVEISRDSPYFALFEVARPLRLLDLGDSDWVTRAGGNGAISSGPRSRSREWARAIYRRYRGVDAVDGVIYPSANIPVARSIALWEHAQTALPARPRFNEPLGLVGLRASVETFAGELNLGVAD